MLSSVRFKYHRSNKVLFSIISKFRKAQLRVYLIFIAEGFGYDVRPQVVEIGRVQRSDIA